ncbi:MAG: CvpA family protein [Planctomycetota bacterium]
MQTYDFVMLFVLGGLSIYGYFKGMAWQVAYVTSFIASYFAAVQFSGRLAPVFGDAAPWNRFVAMAAIYAGCSLVVWVAFRAVRGAIDKVKLQSFDRQMGAFVGAARGVLWCVAVTFFAVTLMPDTVKSQVIGSRSGYYIAKLLDKADAVVPAEIHDVIGPHLARLEQELNSGGQPGQPGVGFPGGGFQNGFQNGLQNQGGAQTGWPQAATGQPAANPGGWPAAATPQYPQAAGNAWPNQATPAWPQPPQQPAGGTPAQPAAWPSQPGGGWPQR